MSSFARIRGKCEPLPRFRRKLGLSTLVAPEPGVINLLGMVVHLHAAFATDHRFRFLAVFASILDMIILLVDLARALERVLVSLQWDILAPVTKAFWPSKSVPLKTYLAA